MYKIIPTEPPFFDSPAHAQHPVSKLHL